VSRFDWMDDALCAQTDPDLFHVEGSGSSYSSAKKICANCPVAQKCADFANELEGDTSTHHRHGLWAGQGPRQRLAHSGHVKRETNRDMILRLDARGGMTPYEIAEHVGVDVRTVWRVTKTHRDQLGKAA
jgi:WhiB family redox-sensing transcriptional regulator